ncbi:MAG TPA: TadE/TadG family type IV pilus assembly protein [Lacipirellulaceae bacterium]
MCNRKKRTTRSGVAAVEFALVAPIFFLLVFGVIEFGRMMMVQQSLTNAAREGSRVAILPTTKNGSDVESRIRDYLQSVMANANSGEVRVTVPGNLGTVTSGATLTVSVEVDYMDVSWVPIGYLGLNPTIAASQMGIRE